MTDHSIRFAAFDGIRETALELGVDPEPIFRCNQLDPDTLNDPDARIPYIRLINTLNDMALATATPHFGLLIAGKQHLSTMGLLGEVAGDAPTIGQAIRDIDEHLRVHNSGARSMCEVEGDIATWRIAVDLEGGMELKQKHLLSIGFGFQILRQLAGPNWLPSRVQFDHIQPEDIRPYKQFFHCPVLFGQEFPALCFPRSVLDLPSQTKNDEEYFRLKCDLENTDRMLPEEFSELFQRKTTEAIEQGLFSAVHIAAVLGISSRTLHRRLREEMDTNFREAADSIRIQIGMKYMRNTTLPLMEIADILGYSELAAFSRAFKRKVGCSPREWRSRA